MTAFQRAATTANYIPAAKRSPSMAAGRLWRGGFRTARSRFLGAVGGCWLLVANWLGWE